MISFKDIFKSSFLENVNAVTLPDMAIALVLAFLVGLFIFFVYQKTYSGVLYSSSFGVTLVALTMITTLVILAVTSNVVLSLGMVGALSIIRFRTASQRASRRRAGKIRMRMPLRTSPRGHRYEKRRQHLIEQEQGDHELHGPQVSAGQHQQPLVGPKKVRMGPSSQRSPAQASSARPRDPSTETVKYGFSLPRLVLKITLPPMPISRPRL